MVDMNKILFSGLPFFFFCILINTSANALMYGDNVENRFHNCMTAQPLGSGGYSYVPCDTQQNSQNFNIQKNQITPNNNGFVEGIKPDAPQIEKQQRSYAEPEEQNSVVIPIQQKPDTTLSSNYQFQLDQDNIIIIGVILCIVAFFSSIFGWKTLAVYLSRPRATKRIDPDDVVAVLGNPKVAREITDRILSNTRLQPFSDNFVKE